MMANGKNIQHNTSDKKSFWFCAGTHENKQEFVCFSLLESYCVSNMDDLSVSLLFLLTYLVIYVRIKLRCFMESGRVEIVQCLAEIIHYLHQLLSKCRAANLFSRAIHCTFLWQL